MKQGDVIIFPTDTVYALATQLYDSMGLEILKSLKSRDDKPLAILLPKKEDIEKFGVITSLAHKVIEQYMPGALTIVLKSTPEHYKKTGEKTVGLRVPKHELALGILSEYGPMRATSVNEVGEEPLNDFQEILFAYQGKGVSQIFDNYLGTSSNLSSTIVDLTGAKIKLIRQGDVWIK